MGRKMGKKYCGWRKNERNVKKIYRRERKTEEEELIGMVTVWGEKEE